MAPHGRKRPKGLHRRAEERRKWRRHGARLPATGVKVEEFGVPVPHHRRTNKPKKGR